MTQVLLPDDAALADLGRFVGRAARMDPGGSIRLIAHGSVLAAYVCALSGGGGPTVLGLRTIALAEPGSGDLTLELDSVRDRLARLRSSASEQVSLDLTPGAGAGAAWAGLLPPRSGWSLEGLLEPSTLAQAAAEGIAAVVAGTPSNAGAAAITQLRARVWGRGLTPGSPVPAGAAFAAEGYGFIGDEPVTLHRSGPWWRLSLLRGHVLARASSGLS